MDENEIVDDDDEYEEDEDEEMEEEVEDEQMKEVTEDDQPEREETPQVIKVVPPPSPKIAPVVQSRPKELIVKKKVQQKTRDKKASSN